MKGTAASDDRTNMQLRQAPFRMNRHTTLVATYASIAVLLGGIVWLFAAVLAGEAAHYGLRPFAGALFGCGLGASLALGGMLLPMTRLGWLISATTRRTKEGARRLAWAGCFSPATCSPAGACS